jgi:hypothetical protein
MTPEKVDRVLTWRRAKLSLYASAHAADHRLVRFLPTLQMVLDGDASAPRGWCERCGQIAHGDAILPCRGSGLAIADRLARTIGGVR